MRILTPYNTTFELNELPNQIDEMNYCVLDYSDQNNVDFYFIPLVFIDQFSRPAADLRIGSFRIQVPLDWSIVICDKDFGFIEIIDLKHINDREFAAFALNPLKSYIPSFLDITIENIYSEVEWNMPRLKHGHILAVPLHDGQNPLCVFFVRETNRLPDSLDISKIIA